jgi:hypothetical protein
MHRMFGVKARLVNFVSLEGTMAMDFRTVNVRFDPTKGQVQREPGTAVFASRVLKAEAALKGFDIGYTDGDHHILRQEVDIDITGIRNNAVDIAVDFLLRDSSGNIDDRFNGTVEVLVLAETA